MSRRLYFLCALILLSQISLAGEKYYKASDIPAPLTENARSVIRLHSQEFIVTDINKGILKVSLVITVLNKNGIKDAVLIQEYDKYRRISAIRGRVFDEHGELIKKISQDLIHDFSAISGYSIYEDNRVKYIDPEIRKVPFTVEYNFEVEYKGLFYYPGFFPLPDYNVSIEKSIYKAIVQKNLALRYLETNMPEGVKISSDELSNTYLWEITNFKALKQEPFSPAQVEFFPLVRFAPVDFEIGGVSGNAATWTSLGDWFYQLNEGRDVLPAETVARIQELVSHSADDYDKINRIYEDLQGRVRYANIKIGMGGWQPIDATTVDRLSYGDCKALTNYMKAMLKAAGIESYYCLVAAGDYTPAIIESFPSMQFNHVILCVPVNADTIWLECTSQHLPGGFLGAFTGNRKVLLVDKGNSRLVNTITYRLDDNRQSGFSQVILDDAGGGTIKSHNIYRGLNYDKLLPLYLADDVDKRKKISERMNFPAFNIINYSYQETKDRRPGIEETTTVDFENYVTIFNARYLLPLNCTNKIKNSPPVLKDRKTAIRIAYSFQEIDTIIYNLPQNVTIESAPEPVEINSDFGFYQTIFYQTDTTFTYIRKFQVNQGIYSSSTYSGLIDFFDRIIMSDDVKCVFVSKQ